jgi:prophage regulatory protein
MQTKAETAAHAAQLNEALAKKREKLRQRKELAESTPDALLKVDLVAGLADVSRATIYRRVAEGTFPKQVHLSARCTRWRAGDVMGWLRSLAPEQAAS